MKFYVHMWKDGDPDYKARTVIVEADTPEKAEEKAFLEYPNFDNFEADDCSAGNWDF